MGERLQIPVERVFTAVAPILLPRCAEEDAKKDPADWRPFTIKRGGGSAALVAVAGRKSEYGLYLTSAHVVKTSTFALVTLPDEKPSRAAPTVVFAQPLDVDASLDLATLALAFPQGRVAPRPFELGGALDGGRTVWAAGWGSPENGDPFAITVGAVFPPDFVPIEGGLGAKNEMWTTINGVREGDSGGPAFDAAGRIVGTYFAAYVPDGTTRAALFCAGGKWRSFVEKSIKNFKSAVDAEEKR